MACNTVAQSSQSSCAASGCSTTNVGTGERIASVLGGGMLAACGAIRGGATGWSAAAAGGALLWRGLSGWCGLYQAMGVNTAKQGDASESESQRCMQSEDNAAANRAERRPERRSDIQAETNQAENHRTENHRAENGRAENRISMSSPDRSMGATTRRMNSSRDGESLRNEVPMQDEPNGRPVGRGELHIGDRVWDSSGVRHGKVIGIEQMPMGTIDTASRNDVRYAVQWDEGHKGEGQLRYEDLRLERH